jgi:hypothetical protein
MVMDAELRIAVTNVTVLLYSIPLSFARPEEAGNGRVRD